MKKFTRVGAISIVLLLLLILSTLFVSAEVVEDVQTEVPIATPYISTCENVKDGIKIDFTKIAGVNTYAVLLYQNDTWETVGYTTTSSYTYTEAVSGNEYKFSLKGVSDDKTTDLTDYDKGGYLVTYYATPITSAKLKADHILLSWNKIDGIDSYKLYASENKSDYGLCDEIKPDVTTYKFTNLLTNKNYRFFVVCIKDNKEVSSYVVSDSIKYVPAPKITKFKNTTKSTTVTWQKIKGVAKYTLYYIKDGKYKKIKTTEKNYATHKKLTDGKKYYYLVRCLDKDGNYISYFYEKGTKHVFYKPPKISTISSESDGIYIKYSKVKGAASYRIYIKTNGGSWKNAGTSDTTEFTYENVKLNNKYTATVRGLDKNGKLITDFYKGKTIKYVFVPKLKSIKEDKEMLGGANIIKWYPVKGVKYYAVFYKTNKSTKWSLLKRTTKTRAKHCGLIGGRTYTYTVRCMDNSAEKYTSAYSKKGISRKATNKNNSVALTALEQVEYWHEGLHGYPYAGMKYFRELGVAPAQWCSYFVSWTVNQSVNTRDIFGRSIYGWVPFWQIDTEKYGRFHMQKSSYNPKPGDIIMWSRAGAQRAHVTVVVATNGKYMYDVGGNERGTDYYDTTVASDGPIPRSSGIWTRYWVYGYVELHQFGDPK